MKSTMSAKDKKFEEERAKYRQRIRELEREVHSEQVKQYELRHQLEAKDRKIYELEEYVERLLEFTEMDKETLKTMIASEETKSKFDTLFGSMFGLASSMYRM